MFGLLWLWVVAVVLGTVYDDTAWFDALVARDAGLPVITAGSDPLCYYFQTNQNCAATAVNTLLGLGADPDLTTFTPDGDQCKDLQRGLRMLVEYVASDVFGNAITSATAASVTNFELLAQIWALQVGNFALQTDPTYMAFATALNSVSDWTTVQCNAGDLEYDGTTIALPDFVVTAYDCDILGAVYAPPDCDINCTVDQKGLAKTCCSIGSNNCCGQFLMAYCDSPECGADFQSLCCMFNSGSSCCGSG